MRYLFIFPVFLFIMSACTGEGISNSVYIDNTYDVSFEYPGHWQSKQYKGDYIAFAPNFDYQNGLTKSSANSELEGFLGYYVDQNPDSLKIPEYYTTKYKDCMSNTVDNGTDFAYIDCENINFDEWKMFKIGGNTAYEEDWTGRIESGETGKRLFVDLDEKNVIVVLQAIKTGLTDEKAIQTISEKAFASLRFK